MIQLHTAGAGYIKENLLLHDNFGLPSPTALGLPQNASLLGTFTVLRGQGHTEGHAPLHSALCPPLPPRSTSPLFSPGMELAAASPLTSSPLTSCLYRLITWVRLSLACRISAGIGMEGRGQAKEVVGPLEK